MENNTLKNYIDYKSNTMSVNPDFIYFDEKKEEQQEIINSRFVISELIRASGGDIVTLHALMCLWAGMSLREAAKVTNRSHESVRLSLNLIRNTSPELYVILRHNKYLVESLVPHAGLRFKWKITTQENKIIYVNNLHEFCRKYRIDIKKIKNTKMYRNYEHINTCKIDDYTVERLFKRDYKKNE